MSFCKDNEGLDNLSPYFIRACHNRRLLYRRMLY